MNNNVNNDKSEQDLKSIFEDAAQKAVANAATNVAYDLFTKFENDVKVVQDELVLPNTMIVSGEISKNQNAYSRLKDDVKNMQNGIRAIFHALAEEIERLRIESVEQLKQTSSVSVYGKQRQDSIRGALRKVNVSARSIQIAYEVMSMINDRLLEDLSEARKLKNEQSEQLCLLRNAALIYEMSVIIIDAINRHQVDGVEEIHAIYKQIEAEMKTEESRDMALKARTESSNISVTFREEVLKEIEVRRKIRKITGEKWAKLLADVRDIKQNAQNHSSSIATLEIMRDNAALRLTTIEQVAITRLMMQNQAVYEQLRKEPKFKLAEVSYHDVARLLESEEAIIEEDNIAG